MGPTLGGESLPIGCYSRICRLDYYGRWWWLFRMVSKRFDLVLNRISSCWIRAVYSIYMSLWNWLLARVKVLGVLASSWREEVGFNTLKKRSFLSLVFSLLLGRLILYIVWNALLSRDCVEFKVDEFKSHIYRGRERSGWWCQGKDYDANSYVIWIKSITESWLSASQEVRQSQASKQRPIRDHYVVSRNWTK